MNNSISDFIDDHTYLSFLIVAVIVTILVFAFAIGLNMAECNRYAELDTAHNYNFGVWGGCLVQADSGRWIPLNRYLGLTE